MASSGRPAEGQTLEAEMNRFEQEIQGPDELERGSAPVGSKFIIGSNTFTQVQQQLSSLRAQVDASRQQALRPPAPSSSAPTNLHLPPPPPPSAHLQAPPPPPLVRLQAPVAVSDQQQYESGHSFLGGGALAQSLVPPPPPPPPSSILQPAMPPPPPMPQLPKPMMSNTSMPTPFMPPQLRHRFPMVPTAPLAPPPTPPFSLSSQGQFNSGMRPPPPPRMPHMFVPPSVYGSQKPSTNLPDAKGVPAATIEKSRVVYAAPPSKHTARDNSNSGFAQAANVAAAAAAEVQRTVQVPVAASLPPVVQPLLVPAAIPEAEPAAAPASKKEKKEKKKKIIRTAAGLVWEDTTLCDWDTDDFRIFCGDLGNEVTDEKLAEAFRKYPSFQKSRVVRDKRTNKTKGYGFVSFKDPNDYTRAMREMNGKYVGNRPIKLRKSSWRERNIEIVKKKEKEKKRLGFK